MPRDHRAVNAQSCSDAGASCSAMLSNAHNPLPGSRGGNLNKGAKNMAKIVKQQPAIDVVDLEFADWRDRDALITFEDGETERHIYLHNDELVVSNQPLTKKAVATAYDRFQEDCAKD